MSKFESGKTKLEKLNGEKRELPKDLKENDHIEKEEVKQKDGHVEDKQNVSFRRRPSHLQLKTVKNCPCCFISYSIYLALKSRIYYLCESNVWIHFHSD
jgi:hypothetical protein